MNIYRLMLVQLVGMYLLSPAVISDWSGQNGPWYRPYLLWLVMIVMTFLLQDRNDAD